MVQCHYEVTKLRIFKSKEEERWKPDLHWLQGPARCNPK